MIKQKVLFTCGNLSDLVMREIQMLEAAQRGTKISRQSRNVILRHVELTKHSQIATKSQKTTTKE